MDHIKGQIGPSGWDLLTPDIKKEDDKPAFST